MLVVLIQFLLDRRRLLRLMAVSAQAGRWWKASLIILAGFLIRAFGGQGALLDLIPEVANRAVVADG